MADLSGESFDASSRSSVASHGASTVEHYSPVIVQGARREVMRPQLAKVEHVGTWTTEPPASRGTSFSQDCPPPPEDASSLPRHTSSFSEPRHSLGDSLEAEEEEDETFVPGLGRMKSFLGPKVTRHGSVPWGADGQEDDLATNMPRALGGPEFDPSVFNMSPSGGSTSGFTDRKMAGKKSLGRLVVPTSSSSPSVGGDTQPLPPLPSPRTIADQPDAVNFLALGEDPYAHRGNHSPGAHSISSNGSSSSHRSAVPTSFSTANKVRKSSMPISTARLPATPVSRSITSTGSGRSRPGSPVVFEFVEPSLPSSSSYLSHSNGEPKPSSPVKSGSKSPGWPSPSPSPSPGATASTTPQQAVQGVNLISLQAARDRERLDRSRKSSNESRPSITVSSSESRDDVALGLGMNVNPLHGPFPPSMTHSHHAPTPSNASAITNQSKVLKGKKSGFLKSLKKAVGSGMGGDESPLPPSSSTVATSSPSSGMRGLVSGPVGGIVVRNGGADPLPPTQDLQSTDPTLIASANSIVPVVSIVDDAQQSSSGVAGNKVSFLNAPMPELEGRIRKTSTNGLNKPSLNLRPVSMAFSAGFSAELLAMQADEDREEAEAMAGRSSFGDDSALSALRRKGGRSHGSQDSGSDKTSSSAAATTPMTPSTTVTSCPSPRSFHHPTYVHSHQMIPVSAPASQTTFSHTTLPAHSSSATTTTLTQPFSSSSMAAASFFDSAGEEVSYAKKLWGFQLWELEKQAKSLREDIEQLKNERESLVAAAAVANVVTTSVEGSEQGGTISSSSGSSGKSTATKLNPCDNCGCSGCCSVKVSVLDRPRNKNAIGGGVMFGTNRT